MVKAVSPSSDKLSNPILGVRVSETLAHPYCSRGMLARVKTEMDYDRLGFWPRTKAVGKIGCPGTRSLDMVRPYQL